MLWYDCVFEVRNSQPLSLVYTIKVRYIPLLLGEVLSMYHKQEQVVRQCGEEKRRSLSRLDTSKVFFLVFFHLHPSYLSLFLNWFAMCCSWFCVFSTIISIFGGVMGNLVWPHAFSCLVFKSDIILFAFITLVCSRFFSSVVLIS